MLFFAIALCIINLILWVVFLSKFKKLFTADDILASYRHELNELLGDVDRHSARSISLIENSVKELKALVAVADRHIAVAKAELERQEKTKAFQQKIAVKAPRVSKQNMQRAANSYMRNAASADESFAVTPFGKQQLAEQGDLFDDSKAAVDLPPTTFQMEADGASFGSVPLVTPEVTYADDPIQPKKDFALSVKELFMRGESVEEIARRLERSTTEVQFALDMGA